MQEHTSGRTYSDTVRAITDFLFLETPYEMIVPSDLVVVLGNDMIEGTVRELERLLLDGKIAPRATVILSGATGSLNAGKENECDRMFRCAVEQYHMPKEMFLLENRATNAYENFLYTKELLDASGGFARYEHILCVGKAFMLRRASMYAAKLGYPAEKLQYYGTVDVEGRNIGRDTWWKSQSAIERVLAEIRRIGEYGLAGDLSIF